MGQTPSFLEPVVACGIIFVVGIVVRRMFGEKALWYVWLAVTGILTIFLFRPVL